MTTFARPRADEDLDAFVKRCGDEPVGTSRFVAEIKGVAKALWEERKRNRDLVAAVTLLQQRVVALETRPAIVYRGVWRSAEAYVEGAIVTDGGSLWIAKMNSHGTRPGSDACCWLLIVKRGEVSR